LRTSIVVPNELSAFIRQWVVFALGVACTIDALITNSTKTAVVGLVLLGLVPVDALLSRLATDKSDGPGNPGRGT
jgi:hypothetical protein